MPATILDGTAIAAEMISALRPRIDALEARGKRLRFAAIRANENGGSASYAKAQASWCAEQGVEYVLENLGEKATQSDIIDCIRRHNSDPKTSAIMLHMPLPKGVDERVCATEILPLKDAEGMHPYNLGMLMYGSIIPGPCTALGAVELAKKAMGDLSGAEAVVVGRSQIVGRPAALLLTALNATVTVVHTRTKDIASVIKRADVIIAAAGAAAATWSKYKKDMDAYRSGCGGKPAPCSLAPMIGADMVKPGAAVIDVGVNRVPVGLDADGEAIKDQAGKVKLVTAGDVDFEAVKDVAGIITSPKGGTGPMTNAMLLRNIIHAAELAG